MNNNKIVANFIQNIQREREETIEKFLNKSGIQTRIDNKLIPANILSKMMELSNIEIDLIKENKVETINCYKNNKLLFTHKINIDFKFPN